MTTKLGVTFFAALFLFSTGYASSASAKKAQAKPEEEPKGEAKAEAPGAPQDEAGQAAA